MILLLVLFIIALSGSNEVFGQEKIREKLWEMFPYCRIGEDQYGAGVYFAPFAAWQVGVSATDGTAKENELYNIIVEELVRVFNADRGKKNRGVTFILEYAGVDIPDMLAPGKTQITMKIFEKISELARAIGKLFFINNLWPRTQVYGTNREEWESQLLRSVPNDVLLQGYGGTNPMPERCDRTETRRKFELLTAESLSSLLNQNPLTLARSVGSLVRGNVGSRTSSLLGGVLG